MNSPRSNQNQDYINEIDVANLLGALQSDVNFYKLYHDRMEKYCRENSTDDCDLEYFHSDVSDQFQGVQETLDKLIETLDKIRREKNPVEPSDGQLPLI